VFRLLRFILWLGLILGFVWFGATVPLGNHTLFGHLRRIWNTRETQDMVKGAEEAARPAAGKVKRAVEAGSKEMAH
jgi:hypothetical protein